MVDKKINIAKYLRKLNDYRCSDDLITIPNKNDARYFAKRKKSHTDFSVANGGENRGGSGRYLLKDYDFLRGEIVNECGQHEPRIDSHDCYNPGIVPLLSLDLDAMEKDGVKLTDFADIQEGYYEGYLKMGEFPNSYVGAELNDKLESLFACWGESLNCTGRLFASSNEDPLSSNDCNRSNLCPEFEYKGNKYVRTILETNKIPTGFRSGVYGELPVRWFRVEPIKFKITNWMNLPESINKNRSSYSGYTSTEKHIDLESENIIMAGVPFDYGGHDCYYYWSATRAYINSLNSGSHDFSRGGLLNQAFDLTSAPTTEYTLDARTFAPRDYMFEGCRGIEKIYVKNFSSLHSRQFANLGGSAQIIFEPDYTTNARATECQNAFEDSPFKNIYVTADNRYVIVANDNEELDNTCQKVPFDAKLFADLCNWDKYRGNFPVVHNLKESGQIRFIPKDYILCTMPIGQIQNFFVNNNHLRYKKLVDSTRIENVKDPLVRENGIEDLFKIYYALGGFSENQGESEKAFDYTIKHIVDKIQPARAGQTVPEAIARELHDRFSGLELKREYNRTFAEFFMKYYKDNPDFLKDATYEEDEDYWIYGIEETDWLPQVHNNFDELVKLYPHRRVNGNDINGTFTPEFVKEHCLYKVYYDVKPGCEKLAEHMGKYGYSDEAFEEAQKIFLQAIEKKDDAVITSYECDEDAPITFRVLAKDDPSGFVIGDITNCCQRLGDGADSCVKDGYLNKNAGFIVFEEDIIDKKGNKTGEKRIIAQAYMWYDPITKTVCYDNIEIPKRVLGRLRTAKSHNSDITEECLLNAVEMSAQSIMASMRDKGIDVERVTTGDSYNDIKKVFEDKNFKRECPPISFHRDYNGYSDAYGAQYIISKYDEKTNAYAQAIKEAIEDCEKDLLEIQENSLVGGM